METSALSLLSTILFATNTFAATAVQVSFTLNTTDRNGLPNLIEYAIGTDPLTPIKPAFGLPLENGFLTQTAAKNPNATGLAWSAESSPDLLNWSTTNITVLQDTPTTFKARDNVPVTSGGQEFLGLNIRLVPSSP